MGNKSNILINVLTKLQTLADYGKQYMNNYIPSKTEAERQNEEVDDNLTIILGAIMYLYITNDY